MRYFSVLCEVWTRPWFRKGRPKAVTTVWAADDMEHMYRIVREHYQGKHWKLLEWSELQTKPAKEILERTAPL